MLKKSFLIFSFLTLFFFSNSLIADEGMWTYDAIPFKQIEERYGFKPSQEFLDHLRLSSVNIYASSSFVSKDGLILTNHHVALFAAQMLSTPEHNFVKEGFVAENIDKELPIPGISVRVLVEIKDVTKEIEESVRKDSSSQEAKEEREKKIASIEGECLKKEGLKGEVVSLFGGAKYSLYKYKEYKDVRLVMIPELQAAFFGGDYDNFTYPRYDLDFAFLRAYENGKPVKVENYLKTNLNGIKDGDLVFVSGHPHDTNRLETLSMLEFRRDFSMPFELDRLYKLRVLLKEYSSKGVENERRARTMLYYVENGIKSLEGEFKGLKDENLMAKKRKQEESLINAIENDEKLKNKYGDAFKEIENCLIWEKKHNKDLKFKLRLWYEGSGLFAYASKVLTYSEEISKPDSERLKGYNDADLQDFATEIIAPTPIYKDLEELLLAFNLKELENGTGKDDEFVKTVLQGKTPEVLAKEVIEGTKFDDPDFRKALIDKQGKKVAKCKDPLLELARRINPTMREWEKLYKDNVEAVEEDALTKIAKAQFEVYGIDTYPDGTGSLRLAFGKIAGYPQESTLIPPFTTFYGLFDRSYGFGNRGDFAIPERLEKNRDEVDLKTPLNFVCTADITGGNSGSPVVDKEGNLVGLVFDGNNQSHPNTFVYDEYQARCVAVDIRAIIESLRKIYKADNIADEMTKNK